MGKNDFARRLQAAKELERTKTRLLTRQEMVDITALVLHETFGFGPERQNQFVLALNAKLHELLDIKDQDTKDLQYTQATMEKALKAAYGPYYTPREIRYGDE